MAKEAAENELYVNENTLAAVENLVQLYNSSLQAVYNRFHHWDDF